jgi:hypothetical protein
VASLSARHRQRHRASARVTMAPGRESSAGRPPLCGRATLVGECMSSPVLCTGPTPPRGGGADHGRAGRLPPPGGDWRLPGRHHPGRAGDRRPGRRRQHRDRPVACSACGITEGVRRDPRAGGIPLCPECPAAPRPTPAAWRIRVPSCISRPVSVSRARGS